MKRNATQNTRTAVPAPRPSTATTVEVGTAIINSRQLRRDAAELKARAKKLLEQADALEEAAAKFEAAEGLPGQDKVRTVHRMEMRTLSKPRGPGRPSESDHPFVLALAKKGLTVVQWAAKHGYKEETVRSWYKKKRHEQRKIPRDAAALIEKELGVPADESAWPQGLKPLKAAS